VTSAAASFAARYGAALPHDWTPPEPDGGVQADDRPPIPPGIPPKPGPAPNAFGQAWYAELARDAVRLLGAVAAETWLNNPTITCDYSPAAFPDMPTPGELAAFRYELEFAARLRSSRGAPGPTERHRYWGQDSPRRASRNATTPFPGDLFRPFRQARWPAPTEMISEINDVPTVPTVPTDLVER
jgi:hypothetical protein